MAVLPTLPRPKWQPKSLSSAPSTLSLDVLHLLDPSFASPLISESLSITSLSTFRSSGTIPAFPSCNQPPMSMIGFTDHLKLFSSVGNSGNNAQTWHHRPALISAPTGPRLRCFLKECLSIQKWAGSLSSTGQPPGHSPWLNELEKSQMTGRRPEGSFPSPDGLASGLPVARNLAPDRPAPSAASMNEVLIPQSSTSLDLIDMLHDLEDLKGLFRAALKEDPEYYHDHPPPSLVISNTYHTLPLSLDSTLSLAGVQPGSLGRRRGRCPAPLIRAHSESTRPATQDGLASDDGTAEETRSKPDDQSPLRVEDMILNLRLQCSSMTRPSESFNSRSPPSRLRRKATGANRQKVQDLFPSDSPPPPREAKAPAPELHVDPPPVHPTRLRSAVATPPFDQSRPPKSVRFALTPAEYEKVMNTRVIGPTKHTIQPVQPAQQPHHHRHPSRLPTRTIIRHNLPLSDSPSREVGGRPTASQPLPSSVTGNSRLNHARSPTTVQANKAVSSPESVATAIPRRSTGTLTRHSLSRIIKGPSIFASRESRRLTTASLAVNENMERREPTVENDTTLRKRHRMSAPLRSIFVRFR